MDILSQPTSLHTTRKTVDITVEITVAGRDKVGLTRCR